MSLSLFLLLFSSQMQTNQMGLFCCTPEHATFHMQQSARVLTMQFFSEKCGRLADDGLDTHIRYKAKTAFDRQDVLIQAMGGIGAPRVVGHGKGIGVMVSNGCMSRRKGHP